MADSSSPGLRVSLRRLGVTALGALHTRLSLAGIEIEEEIQRLVGMLVLSVAALLLAALGILLFSLLMVVLFWDSYRVSAIVAMGALYVVVAALLGLRVRQMLASRPPLLAATLSELERDRDALKTAASAGGSVGQRP